MATSGAMSTTNDKIAYKITITQNSQNITNNTSNVTVSVRVYRTNTGYTTFGTGTVYVTINGTQYTDSITTADKITSSGIVVFTRTLNIAHNADGSKTLATSARITHDQFSSSNQSYSQTLTTIPRATTPTLSASSVNIGESVTISLPRASGSFDHTLTYKFGNATGTIGADIGTSKAWTVPLSFANEIPNATSGTVTITVKTYNGSTLIGTKTVSLTVKVPSSIVPSISALTATEAVSGLSAKFGAYIQNKSKIKVSVNASGSYGSTIKTYKTTIAGKSYTGNNVTSGVITSSGTVAISTTVTDSRGRTATKSTNVSVMAYKAPQITLFSAVRDDKAVNVSMAFAITSLSEKNTKSYTLEYKLKTSTTWTVLASGSVFSYNAAQTFTSFSTEASYDLRLTVTDYFGSVTAFAELATAFTLLDFNKNGKAMAFGKVSELTEGIEFALPIMSTLGQLITSPILLQTGEDLDDLTEPGFYVFESNVSTTLLNNPLSGSASGSIEVVREGSGNQVRQVLTRCSVAYREIWDRLYYSNKWQAWIPVFKGSSGTGRILWSGGMYMTAGHKAELSEPILAQPQGVVLIFSRIVDGVVQDTNFHQFFISKAFVSQMNGYGHTFVMAANKFLTVASKYLYINNERITGHADNNLTGTASGITYDNKSFVLRYVIGV